METKYNKGDRVLFSYNDNLFDYDNIGIVIDEKDNKFAVLALQYKSIRIIESSKIMPLYEVDKVRQSILKYYSSKIAELKSKLKTVTSEEKISERLDKYNDIKHRILKNCERILTCEDDDEFENRLKEINKLKKEIGSIDLECGDIIRKENGKIKYEINLISQKMNISLRNISDEKIEETFNYKW